MTKVDDARFRKCEERIQNALGELLSTKSLSDVSVSELARKASVSRATFYAHYDNVGDVFNQLVVRALSDVRTFEERFQCDAEACRESNGVPYCERIRSRDGEPWGEIVRDARFFPSMMSLLSDTEPPAFDAASLNVSRRVAEALRLFQMSGCHTVATSEFAQGDYWPIVREVLDIFIEGGLEAVRTRRNPHRWNQNDSKR